MTVSSRSDTRAMYRHSHPRIAWRSSGHRMVEIMRNHGFRWTYGRSDAHHFDG